MTETANSSVASENESELPGLDAPIPLRRAEMVFGAASLLISLLLLVLIPYQTTYLPDWEWSKQPALFTLVGIVGMLIFGILEVVVSWPALRNPKAEPAGPEVKFWFQSLEFAAWFMAYVALVPVMGYLFATVAFCLGLTLRLGYRSRLMLGSAVGLGVFAVVLFKSLLSVNVPAAGWYHWLPDAFSNFMIVHF